MAWTARQQKAIEERGKSLLVSAAAGSGKTSVLVERVQRLVLEEGVSLDNMLIVTFTNAAAAEMKERIYKSLSDRLAEKGRSRDEQAWLRAQLALEGRANISTFHKFALEVVHRYYHVIGIAPNLSICEEARQEILQREAMEELMDRHYEAADDGFRAFLDRYANSRGDDGVRTMIREFHKFLQSLPDPDGWMEDLLAKQDRLEDLYRDFAQAQALRRADLAFGYFRRADAELEGLPKLQAKNSADIAFASSLRTLIAQGSLADAKTALEGHRYATMSAAKDEKDAWNDAKKAVAPLRDKAKTHLKKAKEQYLIFSEEKLRKEQEMLLPQLRTLISLTKEFSSLYGAKKSLLGLLDFSDIEHFALRILEDPQVQSEYREKFAHVFIDEYQDSNMVQDRLIERVSRPDNVFRVGDVKQSIYKFRLAEPELFLERYKAFKAGEDPSGAVIDLNSNFRSKREVIDLVNRIFSALMREETTGMEYTQDEALVKGSSYEGPLSYEPVLYLIDAAGEQPAAESEEEASAEPEEPDEETEDGENVDAQIEELRNAELEALQAAQLIRDYHGKPVFDDKTGVERPLQYRDMVILLRAVKGDGEVFYKTLTEAGIPVFLERSEGFFDTMEIQVFLNLLRLIDNRSQDVPLLSVLRSPVFGFCASDLAAIRIWAKGRGETRTPYNRIFAEYLEEGPEGPLKEKCLAFSQKLDRWHLLSRHMPLGDFLWELLTDSGYAVFASAVPAGTQRLANLRALVDKAQQFETDNVSGLYGFISYIDAINSRGGKVEVGQVKILSESEDVVRIMTIHKSKGLEFPFVLAAGLGKQFGKSGRSKADFHKAFGASMRLVQPGTGLYADPLSLLFIRRKKAAEEMAENIRVLYVALTRPKDIVLLLGTAKNARILLENAPACLPGDIEGSLTYLSALLPILPPQRIKLIPKETLAASSEKQKQQASDLAACLENGFHVSEDELPVTKEEIARRLEFDYEPEAFQKEKRKYSVSQIAAMEREKLQALPRELAAEGEEVPPEELSSDFSAGDRRRLPAFLSEQKTLSAAARGTAYHTVMEHLPFTPEDKDPDSIRTFMEDLLARGILTEAEFAAVDPQRVSAFFGSQTGREALAAKELYKEAPFTMRHEMDGRTVLVQGTIDCYFRQDGGWVLVDYKSNYIDKENLEAEMERLRAEYLPQLALYREALEGVTGVPVKKAVLYCFGIDKEISIDEES